MQVSVRKCLPGVRGTLLQHLDDHIDILAILFRGLGSRPGAVAIAATWADLTRRSLPEIGPA